MKRSPAHIALMICCFLAAQIAYVAHAAEHPFHKNTISCEKFSTANDPTGALIDGTCSVDLNPEPSSRLSILDTTQPFLSPFNIAQPRAPPSI